MVMAVAVIVAVPVVVAVPRGVVMAVAAHWNRHAIGLAGTGALALTEVTAVGEPFDVVMVAVLGRPNLSLKAQHLGPVLA